MHTQKWNYIVYTIEYLIKTEIKLHPLLRKENSVGFPPTPLIPIHQHNNAASFILAEC